MNRILNLIMVMAIAAAVRSDVTPGAGTTGAKCSCGVFKSPTPDITTNAPLITKTPNFPIECNETGRETCAKMCIALAEAARDKAPQVLCETLGNTTEAFSPLVYSKICDEITWTNTGLVPSVQVCCSDKTPVSCQAGGI